MHVGWVSVLEPPIDRPRPSFEELREHVARRLCRAPRYRQVLRALPMGIGTPAWEDDPEFDKVGNIAALLRFRSEKVQPISMSAADDLEKAGAEYPGRLRRYARR